MAKKFYSKALSVGLSLAMCAGMVAPAFAATFRELETAIRNGTEAKGIAVTETDDSRTITLEDDVIQEKGHYHIHIAGNSITNGLHQEIQKINNVVLNLNGHSIVGNGTSGIMVVADDTKLTVNGADDSGKKGAITGGCSDLGGGMFIGDSDVTLNKVIINNNTAVVDAEGYCGGGGGLYVDNSTVKLNDVEVSNNHALYGGGIGSWNAVIEINGGKVANNTVSGNGGGIIVEGGSNVEIRNAEIVGNKAGGSGGGLNTWNSTVDIRNSTIEKNESQYNGGGVFGSDSSKIIVGDESKVANNIAKKSGDDFYGQNNTKLELPEAADMKATLESDSKQITGWYYDSGSNRWGKYYGEKGTSYDGSVAFALKAAHDRYFNVIYKDGVDENGGTELQKSEVENGSKIPGYGNETPTREDYTFTGWRLADDSVVDFENGVVDGDLVLVAQWEEAEPESPEPTDPGIDIEEPDVPLGDEPEVEIEDPEVPLAGLFTRADAIGYLWEQTGSPDAELSDFPDVPEDHQWAVAIGWAQDMGIALPDEDGNFRPDDLVLRSSNEPEGELQQFLDRYAVFAGVELAEGKHFYAVEGALDDIIMGEDAQVIFDEFFAKLEAALTEQAA